jgi:hypothetical protein
MAFFRRDSELHLAESRRFRHIISFPNSDVAKLDE